MVAWTVKMATTVYQREISTGHLTDMERLRDVHRISTVMSSLNSMTFSEFFYDLFKSSMT